MNKKWQDKININYIYRILLGAILRCFISVGALFYILSYTAIVYYFGGGDYKSEFETKDLVALLVTYNSLVLSFSVAAVALVIAMPSQEFAQFLAQPRKKGTHEARPFRNLIVSFFQVAALHYISIVASFSLALIYPNKIDFSYFLDYRQKFSHIMLLQGWAFVAFGIALRDIAAVGVMYADHLASKMPATKNSDQLSDLPDKN